MQDLALIGYGEAGQAFAAAPQWRGRTRVFDKLTHDPATRDAKEADYRRSGVTGAPSLECALDGASMVISLVTAGQALEVARNAADCIAPGSMFYDMNSVAPASKRSAAAAIEGAGGHYVDVAIMAPVLPARLGVPILLSGREAPAAASRLGSLGFSNLRVVGGQVGQASSIKMIRSVIVKGIEALTAEAMLAAHEAGVSEDVLASLDASDKPVPWAKRADYVLERMLVHGLRRSEEMEEAAKTLEGLGIDPVMTLGTVRRQREIGRMGGSGAPAGLGEKIERIMGRKADAA
jgi:3-hydroxyisobutyrate dehydrogenase-like beta-hydroxyacid dehydrogenase